MPKKNKNNFKNNHNFIQRFFTKEGIHPYEEVNWVKRTAEIPGSGFKMENVEFPDFYSQNAVNIIAEKYFKVNKGKQETSLKELIDRVVKTFKKWGLEQGYFDEKEAEIYEKELTYIILHQYATFNSPVWFNVGVEGRSQQCSACQPYRSLVSTPFGFIPIGKIVEERLVGLPVYDSKGVTFVTGVKENGFKDVYKIYLKNGLYIEATGDHLVKVSDVYDRYGNKFKWLRVDELKPGMRLYVHFHNVFSDKTYPAEKNVDANQIIYCQSANSSVLTKSKIEIRYSSLQKLIDEAALAGWLQGDGFVGRYSSGTNKSWIIEFMAVNEEQLNYLLPKIKKVFNGVHYKVRETFTKTGRRIWRIRLYGNKLKNFIEKYDLVKRRENMRVPQILFSSPKDVVVSYLRSFFDCEGYVFFRKDKKYNYEQSKIGAATISKNLMEDILILLTGLGIYAKLYRKKEKRQNRQDTYCIEITYGNSKKLFGELIGFISKEKIEKLNIILNEFKHKNHNSFRNEEIVKIEKLGVEKVYDIQTLSGEYLSNNVAIHNCFILDVEDNMESILDWIKIEGLIFKGGSGSGVNLSKLRAKGEKLSTGGTSSGVISFMKAADAVAGSIKCLPKGTEIVTKEGIKKIEDLKENDEVLTRFGFQKIGAKYYTGKKKIYKITTELGIEILASAEHKFLVRKEGGIEEWKELRELDLDKDYLILDLSLKEYGTYQKLEKTELQHHNEKPIKMPEILDEKFAEWLGLLYGDGNITNIKYENKRSTRYIGFQVDAQDKDLIKYIQDLSYELFGVKSFIHRRKDKKDNSVSVRITSHPLIRFLKVNGLYKTKGDKIRVPEKIKNSPPAVRAAFLRGYFESDGSITKNKPYPTCSSINKEFIEDIQELLFSLGILNKKRISKSRKDSYGKKPVYNLIVTSSFGTKRFFNLVNFISERKKKKFERAIKILNGRPFEQRWILPYPENDFEIVYQNVPNENRYFFRRLTSKYFRETVSKTNFNRFRASFLLNKFPFLENTFIGYFAKNDVYYEKIKEIKFVGEKETYDIFVPDVNEYLVKNIVVHNSGGSTRRAAKMVILNADHPEIIDFIRVKAEEENKVRALMEAGYDMTDMNNPLWQNIFFQNANNSVRIPDALMEAAMKDGEWKTYYRTTGEVAKTYKAKDILWEIAKAAWECGDPGVQFDDIIQKWHTCKNSGRIEATNPCSEYLHLNWTSCNLASINLLKFLKEDGSFDVPAFIHTARVMFLSQDLLISKADYPHPKIAEETKKYRTIGLGYTNLGALIMALGLPYDSDPARDLAASITALMTGTAYKLSAEIASKLGPFPEYERNKEPMMEVMKMHKDHLKYVKENEFNKEILEKAKEVWDEVIELGEKYGFRNAQASTLAPTGTISFFMDADTTGIEPDFALVKMKQLVGGGYMKIVNKTVSLALKRLGYSEEQIKDIVKHLEETQNIETAPHIKEEHLPVFDCAIKPPGGKRYIHWMGHVKMVAAVQPFISGGISKTFNMPNETTVQEIYDAYFTAWKLGIKCFAVYRDGSKVTQALYVAKKEKKTKEKIERRKLPIVRQSETHKFSIAGHEGYLTYSMFEDGSLGEIFIRMSKQGSTLAGLLDSFAIAVSIALQYGVPLKELISKFTHMRFEPMGITNNPEIPMASSIVDYIFKYLAYRFLTPEELKELGLEVHESKYLKEHPQLFRDTTPNIKEENKESPGSLAGPPCKYCGGMTTRTGSCYTCLECGESSGGCG